MNIVHLARNPFAGVPIKLARAINQHTPHNARVIAINKAYGKRVFDSDILFNRRDGEIIDLVNDLLMKADVIHVHNYLHEIQQVLKPINLHRHLRHKLVFTQFHQVAQLTAEHLSCSIPQIAERIGSHPSRILAIASQQALTYPGATIVPIVIPLNDEHHRPRKWRESEDDNIPRIVYAPSVTRLGGMSLLRQKYFDKGYHQISAILQHIDLVFDGRIKYQIIRNKSHRDCLHAKRSADIAIDEVKTGSYHTSTLETLSQGLVTIVNPEPRVQNVVKQLTGAEVLPWQLATTDTLMATIATLVRNIPDLREKQKASREWMEKYWNDKHWAPWFIENIYTK